LDQKKLNGSKIDPLTERLIVKCVVYGSGTKGDFTIYFFTATSASFDKAVFVQQEKSLGIAFVVSYCF
jgi:hypothetical protein